MSIDRDTLRKAREKYDEVEKGRRSGWFDPGEYEHLKQQWFDDYGDLLLKALEKPEYALKPPDEYGDQYLA